MKGKKLCNWWSGEYKDHGYVSFKNIANMLLFLLWFVPYISVIAYFYSIFEPQTRSIFSLGYGPDIKDTLDSLEQYQVLMEAFKSQEITKD